MWSIRAHSTALHEHEQYDREFDRQINYNLSWYHVPVNADVHNIVVIFFDE
ncbi:hypothetical protein [Caballeronia ptereochthonis]|uniref:hypothetical protein n=1 Tax=Caballeronia ptereochthonis TaxID=1777144 RepID=UPI000A4AE99E|nr:hypothetical protein [Caballeronia ptereochthonis]